MLKAKEKTKNSGLIYHQKNHKREGVMGMVSKIAKKGVALAIVGTMALAPVSTTFASTTTTSQSLVMHRINEDGTRTQVVGALTTENLLINNAYAKGAIFEEKVKETNAKHEETLSEGYYPFTASNFEDVGPDSWYYDAVNGLSNLHLVDNIADYASNKFNPTNQATLLDVLAIALGVHSLNTTGSIMPYESGGSYIETIRLAAEERGLGSYTVEQLQGPVSDELFASIVVKAYPNIANEAKVEAPLLASGVTGPKDNLLTLVKAGIMTFTDKGYVEKTARTKQEMATLWMRVIYPTWRVNDIPVVVEHTALGATKGDVKLNDYYTLKGYTEKTYARIALRYGQHNYGSKDQTEYLFVMNAITETLSFKGTAGKQLQENLKKFDTDKAYKKIIKSDFAEFGITDEKQIKDYLKLQLACGAVLKYNSTTDHKKEGDSAYGLLKNNAGDCTADAMVYSAVLDALGYNTKLVGSTRANHEWCMVEINGEWWHLYGGTLEKGENYHKYETVTVKDTFNNAK